MFDPRRALVYFVKIALAGLLVVGLWFLFSLGAVYLSFQLGIRPWPTSFLGLGGPVLLGMIPGLTALWIGWQVAGRFVRSLYGLEKDKEGRAFLSTRLLGQMSGGPYLIIKEGRISGGSNVVRKVGGPCGLVLYNDSAVVLERAGRLTRVFRGSHVPPFPLPPPRLAPFEKVWDIIDLRPQRWEFKVSAITQDGIPIKYNADVRFQVGDKEEDIFKAATCKWIREAWRTEPDRVMSWIKLVVIGDTEGTLRSILARYTLDELIRPECRAAVREELENSLRQSTTRLGAKILSVALGDIELKDRVLQQWIDTWQAERAREEAKTIAEGKALGDKIAMEARAEIRTAMLTHTARLFAEMARQGQRISKNLVVLSFIDMIKRTASARSIYLPDDIVKTLNLLESRFKRVS